MKWKEHMEIEKRLLGKKRLDLHRLLDLEPKSPVAKIITHKEWREITHTPEFALLMGLIDRDAPMHILLHIALDSLDEKDPIDRFIKRLLIDG